jgi:hypothetical protein
MQAVDLESLGESDDLNANLGQKPIGVDLDKREPLFAKHLKRRDLAS